MNIPGIIQLGTGKISTFGGPHDHGVGLTEGLAMVEMSDMVDPWFARCFLPLRIGVGLARSLDPNQFYCAMRWDEVARGFDRETIRRSVVRFAAHGRSCFAQPIDYGPGDGKLVDGKPTQDTGRIADLSPMLARYLGLQTDDIVTAILILGGGSA